jgi:hypothetical protein
VPNRAGLSTARFQGPTAVLEESFALSEHDWVEHEPVVVDEVVCACKVSKRVALPAAELVPLVGADRPVQLALIC